VLSQRPGSNRCAGSTICGVRSRPSRSMPASRPSTCPAIWGEPDHDRPPLQPRSLRRTRKLDPLARRAERGATSTVDAGGRCVDVNARGRRQRRQRKHQLSRQNSKPSDGLEPSTPSLPHTGSRLGWRSALPGSKGDGAAIRRASRRETRCKPARRWPSRARLRSEGSVSNCGSALASRTSAPVSRPSSVPQGAARLSTAVHVSQRALRARQADVDEAVLYWLGGRHAYVTAIRPRGECAYDQGFMLGQ
jgi:hypothetical protein